MKRIALTAIVALVAAAAAAATLNETFDRTYDVRAGARFALENTNGTITVHGWDQPRVRIHAEKQVRASDAGLAKNAMAALRIEVGAENGGLRVITRYPKQDKSLVDAIFGPHVDAHVTYDVMVPRTMSLDLVDTNGAIQVADVSGSHRVETTNGRIELTRCGGDIDAETTNGRIHAQLTQVTAGKPMRLATTNGGITLEVPPSLAALVDAATTNGSVECDLPVTATSVGRSSLRGTINGGGPNLRLRTTNGSIEIRAVR